MYADDMMRRLIAALVVLLALGSPLGAQTVTLTEPSTKANWVFGAALTASASNVALSGHWTVTQPTNIACQIYKQSDLSIVQAYTNLTSQSILGGGTWSGTLSAPWNEFPYLVDCKDTGLGTTSAKNVNPFEAGIVWDGSGQSQIAREFQSTGRCGTATMTAGASTTISVASCVTPDQTLYGTWLNGLTAYSCNFTGGNCSATPPTIASATISNASPSTFKISSSVLATGTFTVDVEIQLPTVPACAYRLQNSTAGPQLVGHSKVGSEAVSTDPAMGEIDLGSRLEAAFHTCVMLVWSAVGGTLGSDWIKGPPAGLYYTGEQNLIGSGAAKAAFVGGQGHGQGGSDTLNSNGPVSPATYSTEYADTMSWIHALTGAPPVFSLPLGIVQVGLTSNGEVDGIRQVHYSAIDNTANVFFGGLDWDCEHVAGGSPFHLSELGKTTCYNPRIVQAMLRQSGNSTHGYGPKIASASLVTTSQIDVAVTHEVGGDTLTSHGLSTSGASLTGFQIIDNGNGGAVLTLGSGIASTAFSQPSDILLNTTSPLVCPCLVDYGAGIASPSTNLVYSNFSMPDGNGLPLQHSHLNGSAEITVTGGAAPTIISMGIAGTAR